MKRLLPWVLGGAGAAAGAAFPFVCATAAWPEVVTPAYFISHGLVMYRDILFPHTPLLSHLTAAVGLLFGFSATTFRGIVALSVAATSVLVVLGARGRRQTAALVVGLSVGVPMVLLLTVYTEGPALWPDNWMAPLLLGAALALGAFERSGRLSGLLGGGVLLGIAILVKQTSAWVALAGALWLVLASRRRSPAALLRLLLAVSAPYTLFVLGWFVVQGDWSHLRWTLLVPLQMGRAADNLHVLDGDQLLEMVALVLALPAFVLARYSLPAAWRVSSPAGWLLAGCLGMTYPRGGPLHVAASVGLVAVLLVWAVRLLGHSAKRWYRRRVPVRRLACFVGGAACALTSVGVAVLGGGDLLVGRLGGPTFYWDDVETTRLAAIVRARVRPGDEVLLYNVPRDTLYPLTGARSPGGVYVNTGFWDCLNKEGADERLVAELSRRPGLLVLYSEPDSGQVELRRTGIYRFLQGRTEVLEAIGPSMSWRAVRVGGDAGPRERVP